jgi:RNA polymerase sigma-70 factor, ECF subfamily
MVARAIPLGYPAAQPALSEASVMEALAAGDEAVFGRVYDQYARSVYALALRLTGDRGLAEEIAQETFLRLWRHAATLSAERGRLISWLLRVASRLALDHLRRRRCRPEFAVSLDDQWHSLPDPRVDLAEEAWIGVRRETLVGLLNCLPPAQRQVIELAYFGDLTQAEIAARMLTPIGTVKTRLRLGLARLRLLIEARDARLAA